MPDYDRDRRDKVLPPGFGADADDDGTEDETVTELKGYLPPDGSQNIHMTPYTYREVQGAHQIGRSVITSPEEVILTADEFAQREAERYGLEELDGDVAQDALDAYLGDGDAGDVVSGASSGGPDAEDGSADQADTEDSDAGEWMVDLDGVGPAKADKLEDAGYASVEDVQSASVEDLAAVDGVSESLAESIADEVAGDS